MYALLRRISVLCAVLAFSGTLHAQGSALLTLGADGQNPPATAPGTLQPSPNDIAELGRLLSDERVVAWLRSQTDGVTDDASAQVNTATTSVHERASARLKVLESNVTTLVAAWSQATEHLRAFAQRLGNALEEGEALRSLVYVIIFLVIGAGFEWLYWRYAGGIRHRIEMESTHMTSGHWQPMALRAGLVALGVVLFSLGTLGAFLAFDWHRLVEVLVLSFLLAVVTLRAGYALAGVVLAPRVRALRPLPLNRAQARFLYHWTLVIIAVGLLGGLLAIAIEETALAPELARIVRSAAGTLAAILVIAAFLRWRTRFTDARRGAAPAALSLLVVVIWALWLVGATAIMWTVLLVSLVVLLDRSVRLLLRRAADKQTQSLALARAEDVSADAGDDGVTEIPGRARYVPVLERFARIVLVILAISGICAAWGVSWTAVASSTTPLGRLFRAAVDLMVAYLIADLLWTWAKTAIDRRLADYQPPEPGHAPGPEARLATLLPLFRKALMVTLIIMVALIALSSLGVNVAPLLASAGVVGIAIGFGAQTLVRDIVSGVFFLLDDAFRVGEYIEIDQLRGTVESISVRSLRLRHHRGPVHTIPFGEIKSLTNHSRDWVIMKLEFRVPFDTDLKLVKKLVKKIGAELMEHPEYGAFLIEPLKSQGVRRMEEFNMVVGVKFMAKPGEQWVIRREAYHRVRDAFDANGLNFAERSVKVEVVGGEAVTEDVRDAAIGAAQSAIEQQMPSGTPSRA